MSAPVALPMALAEILRVVPHRPPFCMLDVVVELEPGRRVRAFKNVSRGDPLGTSAASGAAVLPSEMLIEAVGQAALLLITCSTAEQRGIVPLFVGCDADFHDEVPAPCRLEIEAVLEKLVSRAAIVVGRVLVDARVVAEMRLSAGVLERAA